MIARIKRIIESYYSDSAEQLSNTLQFADKEKKRYEKGMSKRQEFLMQIVGKKIFDKVVNLTGGTFAPIPLSGLGLDMEIFLKFAKKNGLSQYREDIISLIREIGIKYQRRQLMIVNDQLYTDIVFNSVDDIIDFFECFIKALNKTYGVKMDASMIDWKPICDKLKKFLF